MPKVDISHNLNPKFWTRTYKSIYIETKDAYINGCPHCHKEVPHAGKEWPCGHIKHSSCGYWSKIQERFGFCNNDKHCRYCCTCCICNKCNRLFKTTTFRHATRAIHPECHKCRTCCTCPDCINCEAKVVNNCPCGLKTIHHSDCCDSNERIAKLGASLLFVKRKPVFHIGTNFQHIRSRRLLSVESEIESFDPRGQAMLALNKLNRKWMNSVVTEGSVPNGGEICTAPASGDKFNQLVNELVDAYAPSGASVGVRCGMHVHVDARDFYYVDLVNLLQLYHLLEPALFAMLPPWRRINRFTVPCGHTLLELAAKGGQFIDSVRNPEAADYKPAGETVKKPSIALKIAQNLYNTKTLMRAKKVHKDANNQHIRYMALNLHSWVYRRTIEFRHWPGSIDPEEMTLWPQICATILETAKRLPIAARRHSPSIKALPSDPCEALLHILKPQSWISKALRSFAEAKLQQWSSDWRYIWPIIKKENTVIPIVHNKVVGGYKHSVCFDMDRNLYSYIRDSNIGWTTQWGDPTAFGGHHASLEDVIKKDNVSLHKLKWLLYSPTPVLQEPKKARRYEPGGFNEIFERR